MNILLIIVDDVGVDASRCYGTPASLAPTPNIDSLCSSGVVFSNVWTNPVCAPTRACMLTGRYSFRIGVGDVPGPGSPGIALDEFALPQALDREVSGYQHACLGKWHLGTNANGRDDNPNLMGFSHYAGSTGGGVPDFYSWTKTTDGESAAITNYATTETVDDALVWVDARDDAPWFLWLAFNAPHSPFHLPPDDLHGYDDLDGTAEDIEANPLPYFQSALEAVDSEIGRLLAALPADVRARTDIIYFGDNGTPGQTLPDGPERRRVKGSPYEGGVHVPLVISGPSVVDAGREVDALVNSTDLFATIIEMAGVDIGSDLPSDSISVVPYLEDSNQRALREWIVAERFGPDVMAKRVDRYKLIHSRTRRMSSTISLTMPTSLRTCSTLRLPSKIRRTLTV
jgi:arylsulfatase A-like enzyme